MSKYLDIHLVREYVVLPAPIMVHSTAEELTQLKDILKRIMNRYENNEYPISDDEEQGNEKSHQISSNLSNGNKQNN